MPAKARSVKGRDPYFFAPATNRFMHYSSLGLPIAKNPSRLRHSQMLAVPRMSAANQSDHLGKIRCSIVPTSKIGGTGAAATPANLTRYAIYYTP